MELKVYTGYGVQKITIGISYGDCENFFGIESIHGIRSTENNHRDKLRDCENFFGTESIHGIRSTENNHRDKLRDCEKCFEWEDRLEEPYRGYSLLVLDTQCSK